MQGLRGYLARSSVVLQQAPARATEDAAKFGRYYELQAQQQQHPQNLNRQKGYCRIAASFLHGFSDIPRLESESSL